MNVKLSAQFYRNRIVSKVRRNEHNRVQMVNTIRRLARAEGLPGNCDVEVAVPMLPSVWGAPMGRTPMLLLYHVKKPGFVTVLSIIPDD